MPEFEIFSNQNCSYAQIAQENLFDKLFGRKTREIEGKRKDDHGFESERPEPFHALGVGGEAQRGRFRAEYFARRGIKRESGGNGIQGLSAFDGGAENRLVAQMDTIEVADGQDAGVAISCIARGPRLRSREGR